MSELDKLVENYFAPRTKTFTKQMLYEMFDEVLSEQSLTFRSDVLDFLKQTYPDIQENPTTTATTWRLTNVGSRITRHAVINLLKQQYELAPDKDKTKGGFFYRGIFPNGDKIELAQGTSSEGRISNKGDVAEGILGAAIFAAFQRYRKKVTRQLIKDVISDLSKEADTHASKSKTTKTLTGTFTDINDDELDLVFKLSLNTGNYKDLISLDDKHKQAELQEVYGNALRYVNSDYFRNILSGLIGRKSRKKAAGYKEFVIDVSGAIDQMGSKADLHLYGKKKKGKQDGDKLQSYSMKKDTRQVAQVGGKSFEKVAAWLGNIFDTDVSQYKEEYETMLIQQDKKTYYDLVNKMLEDISQSIETNLSIGFANRQQVRDLLNALKTAVMKDESNVDLLNLEKDKFRILNVEEIVNTLDDIDLETKIERKTNGPPYLKVYIKSDDIKGKEALLFSIRPKAETAGAFRIYLEYGNFIDKMLTRTRTEE